MQPDVESLPPDLEIRTPLDGPHPFTGIENVVLEGGGSKGVGYVGALLELQQRGLRVAASRYCPRATIPLAGQSVSQSHEVHVQGSSPMSSGGPEHQQVPWRPP